MALFNQFRNRDLIILAIVCACIFLPNLDLFVVNIMEARNFTTAREMVEFNHWLLPTMNGEPRFEKPPLPTWITAVFYYFSGGDNIFLLRLPAALIATLLIFFQYFFTRALTKDTHQALINSLVLVTSFYIIYMGRTGTWDIFCHSFMLGAIYNLYRAFRLNTGHRKYYIYAGILMGLSYLSKGPISFYALLLPFLLAHYIAFGKANLKGHWKSIMLMVAIFILLSFWWMIYIYLADTSSSTEVLKKETTAWLTRHTRPIWHYWSFPVQSGIWAFMMVSGMFYKYCLKRLDLTREYKLAFWWTILSVVLLSLFPEKKERYLLPVLIPGSLCIGFYIRVLLRHFHHMQRVSGAVAIPAVINFAIPILICLAIPVAFYVLVYNPYDLSFAQLLVTGILYWGLAAYMIRQLLQRNVYRLTYATVGILMVTVIFMTPYVNYFFQANPEQKEFKLLRHAPDYQDMSFYSLEDLRIELIWDIGRIVKTWDDFSTLPDDVTFGLFSSEPIEHKLPDDILTKLQYQLADTYDNNNFSPESKKYRSHFKQRFYIISPAH